MPVAAFGKFGARRKCRNRKPATSSREARDDRRPARHHVLAAAQRVITTAATFSRRSTPTHQRVSADVRAVDRRRHRPSNNGVFATLRKRAAKNHHPIFSFRSAVRHCFAVVQQQAAELLPEWFVVPLIPG
jgi:hypothetical protein